MQEQEVLYFQHLSLLTDPSPCPAIAPARWPCMELFARGDWQEFDAINGASAPFHFQA